MYQQMLYDMFDRYALAYCFPDFWKYVYRTDIEYIMPFFLGILGIKLGVHLLKYAIDYS